MVHGQVNMTQAEDEFFGELKSPGDTDSHTISGSTALYLYPIAASPVRIAHRFALATTPSTLGSSFSQSPARSTAVCMINWRHGSSP